MKIYIKKLSLFLTLDLTQVKSLNRLMEKRVLLLVTLALSIISILCFYYFYKNGLGVSYNDARSHLDIARRVVEGLNPGLAQLGSVWLPLPHVLMLPTIWSDFMWHSGLSGALVSMVSFVVTAIIVFLYLKNLGVGLMGKLFGVLVFVANLNVLYLQSTAMTELLLLATMTSGVYYLLLWFDNEKLLNLLKASFFIMLSTLVRYDGWFLILFASILVGFKVLVRKGYKTAEGVWLLFITLGGLGIFLWFLWNLLIFGDPLYFAFGPFSAHAQQEQLLVAGNLPTKGDLPLSIYVYFLALLYNSIVYMALISFLGFLLFFFSRKNTFNKKIAVIALLSPLFFNIIALYLGHSVLFIQGISGNTWFNVRYGIMLIPFIAIFSGYLVDRVKGLRWTIMGLFCFVVFFMFMSRDAVTIDDATVGSSQKNVSEVSSWLHDNAKEKDGFILVSAASHDAIIFSSGLSMKKFIHEGTGMYWESALIVPERWARWIVMRTYDENDLVYRGLEANDRLEKYKLIDSYPFADIYELRDEYLGDLNTKPVFEKQ